MRLLVCPAMIYFRNQLLNHYHRRWPVSLLCSKWEEVVPSRTNHRTGKRSRQTHVELAETLSCLVIYAVIARFVLEPKQSRVSGSPRFARDDVILTFQRT